MDGKTLAETAHWSDAVLFAYAVNHQFQARLPTEINPRGVLICPHAFGESPDATTSLPIPYVLDSEGLPALNPVAREVLRTLLSGENLDRRLPPVGPPSVLQHSELGGQAWRFPQEADACLGTVVPPNASPENKPYAYTAATRN